MVFDLRGVGEGPFLVACTCYIFTFSTWRGKT